MRQESEQGKGLFMREEPGIASLATFDHVATDLADVLGQQAAISLSHSLMRIYPLTSAAAVNLITQSCLYPARKLGNLHAFQRYLQLLEEVVKLAPRGLRPLLAQQDILLQRLGIAALERWVRHGIARYSRDFSGLALYFALENEAAWHKLNLESGNLLFMHERRRIELYLRALWGREFQLRSFPANGDSKAGPARSFLDEQRVIYLPDNVGKISENAGRELYRAAAVHAAAHVIYSRQTFLRRHINPMQNSLIGLIEDARVEALAMKDFPGLRNLWLGLFPPSPFRNTDFLSLLRRLTRALLDPGYVDDNGWVKRGRTLFMAQHQAWDDPQLSIRLGLLLAHDMGQMRVKFNAPGYLVEPSYRDDNRVLWQHQEMAAPLPDPTQPAQDSGDSKPSLAAGTIVAGRQPMEPAEASTEINQIASQSERNALSTQPTFHYMEWDYRLGVERSDRTRVIEQVCAEADVGAINLIEDSTKAILRRLKRMHQTVRPNQLHRVKKQEEGDDIDLDAAILAATDIRQQRTPDLRINTRFVRSMQQVAVLLLLDLSESTNQRLAGMDKTILDLARETAVLFGNAVSDLGDGLAIHGFSSNGRNQVEYYRMKDFNEAYDDGVRKKLAGMTGRLSTRLGAAARHAGHYLLRQPGSRKILLIVSDGEPADIDETDANYLVQDAAQAVRHLRSEGVDCFGLNLNTQTAFQTAHIFGRRGYRILQDSSRLPEILPAIYLRLRA